MVGLSLNNQLTFFVNNKKNQGILDNNIDRILRLRRREQAILVIYVFRNCFAEVDNCLSELDILLNQEVVDFDRATTLALVMKAGTASYGGCRMSDACQELRCKCQAQNRERSLELLQLVKEEYVFFHDCLDHIIQIAQNMLNSGIGFRRG